MFPPPFAQNGDVRWDVLYAPQDTVLSRGWKCWEKPDGAQRIWMTVIGSGGGGGNGFSRAAGSNGGGGGGGGSGNIVKLLIPAFALPSRLFVRVGRGSAANSGVGGTSTYISTVPNSTQLPDLVVNMDGGGVGTNGASASIGAAGSPGTNIFIASLLGMGLSVQTGGQSGNSGGAVAGGQGGVINYPGTTMVTGGAGGAGGAATNWTGGSISSNGGQFPTLSGGVVAGGAGQGGFGLNSKIDVNLSRNFPLYFSGGTGGGGNNAGVGGAGGAGAYGCGGGGGGVGVTGGIGGAGGDGLVIIGSW